MSLKKLLLLPVIVKPHQDDVTVRSGGTITVTSNSLNINTFTRVPTHGRLIEAAMTDQNRQSNISQHVSCSCFFGAAWHYVILVHCDFYMITFKYCKGAKFCLFNSGSFAAGHSCLHNICVPLQQMQPLLVYFFHSSTTVWRLKTKETSSKFRDLRSLCSLCLFMFLTVPL